VVIPLPRMAEYTDGIERINIELSLRNKIELADELEAFLGAATCRWASRRRRAPPPELLDEKVELALAQVREVRALWQGWLRDIDRLFPQLQDHRLRASWKTADPRAAARIFTGSDFEPLMAALGEIQQRVLKGRVWIALHMHAGDGNVHTNIPVHSDNYQMLQTAHEAVDRVMALARSLDGVISGEHGIGITKLEYLSDAELAPFADYKQRVDPEGRFNRGKLLRNKELPRTRGAGCGPI
jgi:FAD/FMN-containing dehydrogenase